MFLLRSLAKVFFLSTKLEKNVFICRGEAERDCRKPHKSSSTSQASAVCSTWYVRSCTRTRIYDGLSFIFRVKCNKCGTAEICSRLFGCSGEASEKQLKQTNYFLAFYFTNKRTFAQTNENKWPSYSVSYEPASAPLRLKILYVQMLDHVSYTKGSAWVPVRVRSRQLFFSRLPNMQQITASSTAPRTATTYFIIKIQVSPLIRRKNLVAQLFCVSAVCTFVPGRLLLPGKTLVVTRNATTGLCTPFLSPPKKYLSKPFSLFKVCFVQRQKVKQIMYELCVGSCVRGIIHHYTPQCAGNRQNSSS